MEKMFTTDVDFFNTYYVLDPLTNKPKKEISPEEMKEFQSEDYYRYLKAGNMLLRSQIDTAGEDENGRYDITNYIDYLDYNIIKFKGTHSSFEREFYDLIRGGFLKYIMQMKIGQM